MKALNTRQRANTTGDTIPRPRFNNPDAFPQSGLQDNGQTSTSNTVRKRNNTVNAHAGSQRAGWNAPHTPAFDFQLSTAPEAAHSLQSQENISSDDSTTMIGVAVGSPTMHRTAEYARSHAVSPVAIDFDSMGVAGSAESESSGTKPSKWKKISDFFKAKNSLQQHQQQEQQQLEHHSDDRLATSHECRTPLADSRSVQNREASSEAHTPWDDHEFEHRMGKPSRELAKDMSRSPRGKEPRKLVKYVEPPKPNKSAPHRDKPIAKLSKPEEVFQPSEPEHVSRSLLNVEIPEVRLERYSVMFGSVLGKPPSTTLLARRSKTLDMLKTHYEEDELGHTEIPLTRRATSPALTKSPAFTLFPAAPTSKPTKALHNTNFPRPNVSLQLSNATSQSPNRELNEKSMPAKDSTLPQTGTSSMATSSSSRSQWVSEGASYLSMVSTSSSSSDISLSSEEDEVVPFTYKKPVPISTDEPMWEILNPTAKAEPPPTKSKSLLQPQRLRTIRSEESFAAITEQTYAPSTRMTNEETPVYPKQSDPKSEARVEAPYTEFMTPPQPQRLHITRSEEPFVSAAQGPHDFPPKHMASEELQPPPTKPHPESKPKSEPKPNKPIRPHPIIDIEQWLPQLRPPPPQREPPTPPPAPSPTIALPPVPVQPPHAQARIRPKPKSRPPPSTKINPNRQAMKTIEVSVARSVSVTKQPKQVIVPMSAMRSDSLHHSDERFGDKRSATPMLISAPRGHEREKSQAVPIEVAEPEFI
ncbi:hypothetical protein RJZ56_002809 [Blastomyces dermatitidis]|uniref:Uncharacterized protein n=1 Tax=Ajellomyces dermatitidis (strain ER-3 / ATCC MYA-2586) TaxID=559297 RepID=A0ABP2ERA0_AJEDR|nr:uncharacterized protein BDCG_09455 [Blastomyces dermatitidis ER-3]XP_045282947.1 hypothetical protein, variant [Blastomyces dermatitidis ER-3]EEQ86186.1 hypothetical protein BDCG_09455 [Blastomyces dermatitidis ER-3]OAT03220.1 hypothetical protein, variant [Blastomyces dermatitidis ER-3]